MVILFVYALVAGELAEDEVLVCASLVLFDNKVVRGSQLVMPITCDLCLESLNITKGFCILQGAYFSNNLVQYGYLVLRYNYPLQRRLLYLRAPRMPLYIFYSQPFVRINLYNQLYQVFGLRGQKAWHEVIT